MLYVDEVGGLRRAGGAGLLYALRGRGMQRWPSKLHAAQVHNLEEQLARAEQGAKHGSDTMAELATDLMETQQKLKERDEAAAERADENQVRSRQPCAAWVRRGVEAAVARQRLAEHIETLEIEKTSLARKNEFRPGPPGAFRRPQCFP